MTLQTWLTALADGPIHAPLLEAPGRAALLEDLRATLEHPERINQGCKGTCAATFLATTQPGEYARLIVGLVRPEGRVTLANGDDLVRDENGPLTGDDERGPVNRLFQAAAMEYANGDLDYDPTSDVHRDEFGAVHSAGLDMHAFDTLIEAVTNETWEVWSESVAATIRAFTEATGLSVATSPVTVENLLDVADGALQDGGGAFATLAPPDLHFEGLVSALGGGPEARQKLADASNSEEELIYPHKVRITRIDKTADRVFFDDPLDAASPWFRADSIKVESPDGLCSMAAVDFLEMTIEFSTAKRHWPA
ncbi:MAG: hypothetical protein GY898_14160 [Proteobacteria bacterium]|nr:hypothetical protein [Pseudomonadota bacterium]